MRCWGGETAGRRDSVGGAVFGPGDGERVGFPGVDLGEAEVGMAAGLDGDMAWEVKCHTASISIHCLDSCRCPAFPGEVAIDDVVEAC